MTPLYLAFKDEQEANTLLYKTVETKEWVEQEDGTSVEVTVLTPLLGFPLYQNISVLGTVYEPAPEPIPEDYVPVPYPAPNYGVNVLVLDGEDSASLEPYAVTPSPFPQRVWAI
jgi:hypothetical protein